MLTAVPTIHHASLCNRQEMSWTDTNINNVLSVQPFKHLWRRVIIDNLMSTLVIFIYAPVTNITVSVNY